MALCVFQASRERIKKLNARCRELEEDNERLRWQSCFANSRRGLCLTPAIAFCRGQVQEQEARIKETIDGRWAQAYAESLKLKVNDGPLLFSDSHMSSLLRHHGRS